MALFGLCGICNGNDLRGGEDGYFYCSVCGSQSQQFQEQALDFDDAAAYTTRRQRNVAEEGAGAAAAAAEGDNQDVLPSSHVGIVGVSDAPQPWEALWGPPKPHDSQNLKPVDPMETLDADADAIRSLYIEGLQYILQLQCEALVQNFQVSPLICGIFGPIWLRFIAYTCVLEKDWGREAIQTEEARNEIRTRAPKKKKKQQKKKKTMRSNEEGLDGSKDTVQMKMALPFIWLNALKERIPLAVSLAIVFLSCHIAGEAILPTDIVYWALRGTLPYLAAFNEVEKKKLGLTWPIEARVMLKPVDVVGAKKLEFMAASIAQRIGLYLPPVNYDAISCRLLKDLNLPVERLSTFVHRIFDWYRPPELCLSDKAHALPTRVYVMAMVMITLKILYKIDGQPYQETQDVRCGKEVGSPSDRGKFANQAQLKMIHATRKDILDASEPQNVVDDSSMRKDKSSTCEAHTQILREGDDMWNIHILLEKLEKSWSNHVREPFDFEKDTESYVDYCQNFIFTGLKLEREEESLCERLRTLYEHPPKQKDAIFEEKLIIPNVPEIQSLSEDSHISLASFNAGGSQKEDLDRRFEQSDSKGEHTLDTTPNDVAHCKEDTQSCSRWPSLEQLLNHMELLGFQCLTPRKAPLNESKYLRYVRRKASTKGETACLQLVHADYFMVLCACAHVIRVHPGSLHWCIQRLEKRILGMEESSKDILNQS